MAFEDDMIEAGYSDEQEYLESLFDDFEENYSRKQDCESEYDEDVDSSYYEEEERRQRERRQKFETERQWLKDWKNNNTDLAIIWKAYFRSISYLERVYNMNNRYFMGLNECKELKKWLNERKVFEDERQKDNWQAKLKMLFSMYKKELFKSYFPDDEKCIYMSFVPLQAHELQSLEFYEPLLWETVCSCYAVNPKLFDGIEEKAFWEEKYNSEMDYEYWKDNNIEKYNQFAKKFIAESASYWNNAFCEYGEWMKKHEKEGIEWKQKNLDLWDKYKRNYEIREKNKYIESKIQEYKDKKRRRVRYNLDSIEDYFDLCENKSKPFLPDLECTEETPFDISSLDEELHQFIQDSISSLDMINVSADSSKYADKVMTQLWIYAKRDEWEMDALKKNHGHLIRYENIYLRNESKYSNKLITWWKKKYSTQWSDFVKTVVPTFKINFEIVMKFRLWALDGHKEEFFSLSDKYLLYWNKTLKFMYGQDLYDKILNYFHNEHSYPTDFWGEPVDCIKKIVYTYSSHEVNIWQKELQDQVIWDVFYNKNYKEHYCIESMYTSLR